MAEFIKERKRVERVRWVRAFHWKRDSGSGFSFDCDKDGNLEPMAEPAKTNRERCPSAPNIVDDGIEEHHWHQWDPAIIRCTCGAEVVLEDRFASSCERCGREYNGSGQLLAPRSQWGAETGETEADWSIDYDPEETEGN